MVSYTSVSSEMLVLLFSLFVFVYSAKPSLKNGIVDVGSKINGEEDTGSEFVRHARSLQDDEIDTEKRLLDKVGSGLVKRKNDVIQRILPKLEYYLVQSMANKAYEKEQENNIGKRGFDKIGMGLIKRRLDRIGMGLIKKRAFDKLGMGLIKRPFDQLGMGLIKKRPSDNNELELYTSISKSAPLRPPKRALDRLGSGLIKRFKEENNDHWEEKRYFDRLGSGLIKKLDQDSNLSDSDVGTEDNEDYNKRLFDPLGSGLIR